MSGCPSTARSSGLVICDYLEIVLLPSFIDMQPHERRLDALARHLAAGPTTSAAQPGGLECVFGSPLCCTASLCLMCYLERCELRRLGLQPAQRQTAAISGLTAPPTRSPHFAGRHEDMTNPETPAPQVCRRPLPALATIAGTSAVTRQRVRRSAAATHRRRGRRRRMRGCTARCPARPRTGGASPRWRGRPWTTCGTRRPRGSPRRVGRHASVCAWLMDRVCL